MELQEARYGMACPPHIIIEIESLKEKIYTIEQEIEHRCNISSSAFDLAEGREMFQSEVRKLIRQELQQELKDIMGNLNVLSQFAIAERGNTMAQRAEFFEI